VFTTCTEDKENAITNNQRLGRQLFQSRLDHFCWKVMRKVSNYLSVLFLEDVRSVYR